ncbi:glutathione S-transferase family protein [Photobacterium sp. 1_MG-2023]|uniref:glutathione S-transferase family protein n=1 Tax=Photobacterium sp. 1_MG-2023 TaxID=3062646 RepID=UPI0026E30C14|nr:glutathione S-transferase [Photobacterium sp. 1_MG-2023]MDO6708173.1 glutathione S-transferase [Photobacterium sp. 1_MG-2023]
MIKLHHLNQSRSKRIIWLLEELGLSYEMVPYQRDAVTFLAPPELKSVHPLGKSPVLEDGDLVLTESGAITEYLIETYGEGRLAPQRGTPEYAAYVQWIHFAESSAMLPMLLKMFLEKDGCETHFLAGYADKEMMSILTYLDQSLAGKKYLVAEQLSGADIMMSFMIEILYQKGGLPAFPNLARYAKQLLSHESYVRSNEIESGKR